MILCFPLWSQKFGVTQLETAGTSGESSLLTFWISIVHRDNVASEKEISLITFHMVRKYIKGKDALGRKGVLLSIFCVG